MIRVHDAFLIDDTHALLGCDFTAYAYAIEKLITFYLFNFHRETKRNYIISSRRLHGNKLLQQLHRFNVMMMKQFLYSRQMMLMIS